MRRLLVFAVLLVSLIAAVGCSGPGASSGPPPGQGTSTADKFFLALKPVQGELLTPPDINDESDVRIYLLERAINLADSDPSFKIVDQPNVAKYMKDSKTHPGKIERGNPYVFADGSTIVIVGVPPGAESANEGLAYDRTDIIRP